MKIASFLALLFIQVSFHGFCQAQDWPGFARYRDSNEVVKATPDPGNRVVFMGNSITDAWIRFSPDFFTANNYVDRGISGQTSPQMLVRFRADVISLKPKVVLILAGTNDIAGNTGPSTLEMIEDNIMSMAELAKMNNIKVILCSVLPAFAYPWKPEIKPVEKIAALNQWIKGYADKNDFFYLDYYTALADGRKGIPVQYSEDGVHPNKAGYTIMEKLAQPLIRKALEKTN